MSKIALVTGTSTGLGISTVVLLAGSGFKVFATMRNPEKSDALKKALAAAKVTAEILPLDVQDPATIESCVGTIVKSEGRIDILVNNAGAGFARNIEQATEDEINWILDVNLTGVMRCTKAVLPHMRKARSGHIINISSVGGLVGQPFNEVYCAAKFGVEGFTESLSTYVTPAFNVKFTIVEPGGIVSEFANTVRAKLMSGPPPEEDYAALLAKYVGGAQARAKMGIYQEADDVAKVILACIENPNPPLRIRTSEWSRAFCELKTQADPDGTKLQKYVYSLFLGS